MSIAPDTLYYGSLGALAVEVVLSINNARISKQGNKIHPVYGIVPAVCFLLFHFLWWASSFHNGWSIFGYVLATVASVAFLFGSSFVSTGCLELRNGELCVDKDNPVFKMFAKLPIKFDGKSLCSISWLAALSIFFVPVVVGILGAIFAIITIVICLFIWQNPIPYYVELMGFKNWPETKFRRTKHNIIISPTPWLLCISVGGYGGYFLIAKFTLLIPYIVPFVSFLVVASLVYFAIGMLSDRLYNKFETMTEEDRKKYAKEVIWAVDMLEDKGWQRMIFIWDVFWQVFRQKFCPKIKYCSCEEMNCEEDEDEDDCGY